MPFRPPTSPARTRVHLTVPMTLASVTSDATRLFTTSASSPKSASLAKTTPPALSYVVQAAPTLTLSNFRP